ncbi:MAG: thymidine phosphorylase [Nitriliruptorales bacterium]|nr:thymidine phosphorylase [Nitriliruptorales bacterium]
MAPRSAPDVQRSAPVLIGRKREGGELDLDELRWLVTGYLEGGVSEGQTAAWLMAGVIRGFSPVEARALTQVLIESGEVLDLSGLTGPTVDKHSTGGVADGTTLLVAPLLASVGLRLVKLSGRGLGHTGGTLDKLESIPGLRTALEPDELLRIADEVGCVVAAQTARLVPADKALYALRDITATVASPALIASSVMSKKIAAGAQTIVLDVKTGDGAFMPSRDEAAALARLCVGIGADAGRPTVALVTAMDQPLGTGVGNALEVEEAVRLLSADPDGRLAEVALALAAAALQRGGTTTVMDAAGTRDALRSVWCDGTALETLARMIAAQGGDATVCEAPARVLPQAPVVQEVSALHGGTVAAVPARAVGELAARLGAGRSRPGEDVDPAVGIVLNVEVGDEREPGDVLATVHARTEDDAAEAGAALRALVQWTDDPVQRPETILERVDEE